MDTTLIMVMLHLSDTKYTVILFLLYNILEHYLSDRFIRIFLALGAKLTLALLIKNNGYLPI